MIDWLIINFYATLWDSGLGLLCLTPLSTIFQLYRGDQLCWWRKKPPTCHKSLTKLNHIMLCTQRKPPTCHKSLTKLYHIMLCTRRKPPTCHKSLTKLYHIMLCTRRKPPTCHKSLTKLYHIMLCTRRKPPTCHKSLTKLNHIMLCTQRKPPTCHKSLTKLYHIMLYRVHPTWEGFELTILVVIGIDLNNSVICTTDTILCDFIYCNIIWFYILYTIF